MKRAFLLSLLFISLLFGCQREVSYFGGPDNPAQLPTPDPITSVVQGNVLDETGAPAAGVSIEAGSKTATTDQNGYFRIADADLDKKAAVVKATKPGYFKAYRTFAATSGTNQVVIKLIKKALAGSVSASAGGEVALSNGSKVALPSNGIVTASNNSAYTGTVNVYASYIDPTSADIQQTVPGSLLALNKDNKRVLLSSYGMLAVELESGSGEKLQIKSGAAATLTTAIPSAVQASAPATIALWSVDETTGVWKEEGTATKNGSVYIGEVKHFSFWNCDVAQNTVTLSLTLKNSGGKSLVHAAVRIQRPLGEGVSFATGYTDSLGQVSGYVPAGVPLVLDVLDDCGNSFYSQNVSALTQSTDLGVVNVSNTGSAVVTVKGKLVNCSNAAVTNGYAIISYGYRVQRASVNASGDFETTFTRCSSSPSTIDVVAVDNSTQQQSSTSQVALTTPLTNLGTLSACGTSSAQFINYTLDGVNYSITTSNAAQDSLYGYTVDSAQIAMKTTYLVASKSPDHVSFQFRHTALANGTFAISSLAVQSYWFVTLLSPFNVVVTNFPQAAGQFYEGSFSGSFKDGNNASHTLSGTFKLRRMF